MRRWRQGLTRALGPALLDQALHLLDVLRGLGLALQAAEDM
jgi:hypothetical protein